MNLFKYLFYNLFCFYHIDGEKPRYKKPDSAADFASSVMATGFTGWFILIDVIYTFIIRHNIGVSTPKVIILITGVLIYIIIRFFYISKNKYQKIIDEYRDYDIKYKTLGRIISMGLFASLPFMMLCILFFILPGKIKI